MMYRLRLPSRFPSGISIGSDITARYLSTIFSFLILLTLTRIMPLESFANLQVATSISSLIIWIGDGGLGVLLIQEFALGKKQKVLEIWSFRTNLMFILIIGTTIFCLNFTSLFITIFIWASFFDLFTDSNLNFRQVTASSSFEMFLQPIKKFVQFSSIYLPFQILNIANLNWICASLILPSILIFLYDCRKYGGYSFSLNFMFLSTSIKKWIPNGGLVLINLDNIVLNYFKMYEVISLLAVVKKIYSSLAIAGTALFPRILLQVSRNKELDPKLKKEVFKMLAITTSFATVVTVVLPKIFDFLEMTLEGDNKGLLMSRTYVLTLPIAMMCLAMNSILVGLNKNLLAGFANYLSSFLYLISIAFICKLVDGYLAITYSSLLYFLSWFILELMFLKKLTQERIM